MLRLLRTALEIVVVLFGAFAGFLLEIAPPARGAPLAVGIAQFVTLAVLLFVFALKRGRMAAARRWTWLIAATLCFAGFLAAAVGYYIADRRYVFIYPPGNGTTRLICGAELGVCGEELVKKWPDLRGDCSAILFQCGDPSDTSPAWTMTSQRRAEVLLTTEYVFLVGLLSATLCLLIESGPKTGK